MEQIQHAATADIAQVSHHRKPYVPTIAYKTACQRRQVASALQIFEQNRAISYEPLLAGLYQCKKAHDMWWHLTQLEYHFHFKFNLKSGGGSTSVLDVPTWHPNFAEWAQLVRIDCKMCLPPSLSSSCSSSSTSSSSSGTAQMLPPLCINCSWIVSKMLTYDGGYCPRIPMSHSTDPKIRFTRDAVWALRKLKFLVRQEYPPTPSARSKPGPLPFLHDSSMSDLAQQKNPEIHGAPIQYYNHPTNEKWITGSYGMVQPFENISGSFPFTVTQRERFMRLMNDHSGWIQPDYETPHLLSQSIARMHFDFLICYAWTRAYFGGAVVKMLPVDADGKLPVPDPLRSDCDATRAPRCYYCILVQTQMNAIQAQLSHSVFEQLKDMIWVEAKSIFHRFTDLDRHPLAQFIEHHEHQRYATLHNTSKAANEYFNRAVAADSDHRDAMYEDAILYADELKKYMVDVDGSLTAADAPPMEYRARYNRGPPVFDRSSLGIARDEVGDSNPNPVSRLDLRQMVQRPGPNMLPNPPTPVHRLTSQTSPHLAADASAASSGSESEVPVEKHDEKVIRSTILNRIGAIEKSLPLDKAHTVCVWECGWDKIQRYFPAEKSLLSAVQKVYDELIFEHAVTEIVCKPFLLPVNERKSVVSGITNESDWTAPDIMIRELDRFWSHRPIPPFSYSLLSALAAIIRRVCVGDKDDFRFYTEVQAPDWLKTAMHKHFQKRNMLHLESNISVLCEWARLVRSYPTLQWLNPDKTPWLRLRPLVCPESRVLLMDVFTYYWAAEKTAGCVTEYSKLWTANAS